MIDLSRIYSNRAAEHHGCAGDGEEEELVQGEVGGLGLNFVGN